MITTLHFEGKAIHVYPHETVLAALLRSGVSIAAGCGGKKRCGTCRIKLLSGTFCSDGKILTVSAENPAVVNSCSLKMLSNGFAEYPDKKSALSEPELSQRFMPDVPGDLPVTLVLDIGTTNIEAVLISSGKISKAGTVNQQTSHGDNVIERIAFADSPSGRQQLNKALIEDSCLPLIDSLTETPQEIRQVLVSGNTAMTHFFFNKDTTSLGRAPFQPEQTNFSGSAQSTGLSSLLPDVPVKAVSCLGGFIGGDITSGLFLTGFGRDNLRELYMDLGTNCEILLNDHGKYYALSTAAGPAFERNNLRNHNRGAVRHIEFNENIWQLIPDNAKPAGYCGTALVDLLAEGRRHGFLDKFAQWIKKPQLPEELICSNAVLSELVTAKAAIESGLKLLFQRAGIASESIDRICIAGNFAENLNIANAVSIGILPDLSHEKFIRCGNAALVGTILCAITDDWTDKTEKIRQDTILINPAEEPDYMRLFASAMSI